MEGGSYIPGKPTPGEGYLPYKKVSHGENETSQPCLSLGYGLRQSRGFGRAFFKAAKAGQTPGPWQLVPSVNFLV